MRRTTLLALALFCGSPLAMAQMPLEGVGSKNVPIAPAARGIFPHGNSEGLDVPRVEIFSSFTMVIPSPAWQLPSDTRGVGFDGDASIYWKRWLAAEGDFGWSRAWASVPGVSITDNGTLFSGGPRVTYRQGRLAVFGHALFGANRLTASFSVPGVSLLGVPVPGTSITDTAMAAVLGGGADMEIRPNLALRTEVDFLPTHHLSQIQNNHRVLFGLVFKH